MGQLTRGERSRPRLDSQHSESEKESEGGAEAGFHSVCIRCFGLLDPTGGQLRQKKMPSCLSPSGFLRKQQQKAPSGVNYGIVTHQSVYEIFDELQFEKKTREDAEEREREKARVERDKKEKEEEKEKKDKEKDSEDNERNSTCSTQCSTSNPSGQAGVIEHWDTDNVNNANNPEGKSKNNNKVSNPAPQGCPHGPYCDECRIAISRLTLPFCMGCKALIQQWRPRAVGGVLGIMEATSAKDDFFTFSMQMSPKSAQIARIDVNRDELRVQMVREEDVSGAPEKDLRMQMPMVREEAGSGADGKSGAAEKEERLKDSEVPGTSVTVGRSRSVGLVGYGTDSVTQVSNAANATLNVSRALGFISGFLNSLKCSARTLNYSGTLLLFCTLDFIGDVLGIIEEGEYWGDQLGRETAGPGVSIYDKDFSISEEFFPEISAVCNATLNAILAAMGCVGLGGETLRERLQHQERVTDRYLSRTFGMFDGCWAFVGGARKFPLIGDVGSEASQKRNRRIREGKSESESLSSRETGGEATGQIADTRQETDTAVLTRQQADNRVNFALRLEEFGARTIDLINAIINSEIAPETHMNSI